MITYSPSEVQAFVCGAVDAEVVDGVLRIHRIGRRWRAQIPTGYARMVEEQAAGVRLEFLTSASRLVLRCLAYRSSMVKGVKVAASPFECEIDGQVTSRAFARPAATMWVDALSGNVETDGEPGEAVVSFDFGEAGVRRNVKIWLPYPEIIRIRALEADAPLVPVQAGVGLCADGRPGSESGDGVVEPGRAAARPKRWVHYGSSISQGVFARFPTATWPAAAARLTGLELTNLGFSGNAVLDSYAARTIAELPADVISLEIGGNIVTTDALTSRSFTPALHGFLDIVRDAHPDTPILLITALASPLLDELPGPVVPDGKRFKTLGTPEDLTKGRLNQNRIRELIVETANTRNDSNLTVVRGPELFSREDEREHPLIDALHPDRAGHELIARRFAEKLAALYGDRLGVMQ
ncbi:MAG: GDSL-type esterase/lipase family protein [Propionibacteriaceae bacterium]|nr:GDSL-type esterase/lipase family protein [Propionibacteriaceae bacterium]